MNGTRRREEMPCPRCGSPLSKWKCKVCPFRITPGKEAYAEYLKATYFWEKVCFDNVPRGMAGGQFPHRREE